MTKDEFKRLFSGDLRMDRTKEQVECTIKDRAIYVGIKYHDTYEVVVHMKHKDGAEEEFIAEPFKQYDLADDVSNVVIDTVCIDTKQAVYHEYYKIVKTYF